MKNHDFQGRLEAKLNELNKNQYEIRNIREKLYQKTSISKLFLFVIRASQRAEKRVFSLFGKLA